MKSIPKLIRRVIGILLLSFILLLILNITLLGLIASQQRSNSNASPWKKAEATAAALSTSGDGWQLSEEMATALEQESIWAIRIDNATHHVTWNSPNLPETVPLNYSLSDIAALTRGYIDSYPTFTAETKDGLLVLGYPRDRFWKHMWPSWNYSLIAHFPQLLLAVLGFNFLLILLIYIVANTRLLKSITPIVDGIQRLPKKDPVKVSETGLLSELAQSINQTANVLESQSHQLEKKEVARANWISGVSHDIRTPLSMVMGYAGQLEADPSISLVGRQKAGVILKQSGRIKNLVEDLNLSSKLEYTMHPLSMKAMLLLPTLRQIAVDFINSDLDGSHPIFFNSEEFPATARVCADSALLKRAVINLIQNAIDHNPDGCTVYFSAHLESTTQQGIITIEDNGGGLCDEALLKIQNTSHYMLSDDSTAGQRHGLGLLIVRQIVSAHHGEFFLGHSAHGGLEAKIILPLDSFD